MTARAALLGRLTALAIPVAGLVAIAACGIEPDVGGLLAGVCNDADTNPAVNVSFASQIQPIINRPDGMAGCSCHMVENGAIGSGTQLSGLNLTTYSSLRAGGINSGANVIIAREPCESVLYQKVSDAPPFGSRMPLGGPYLSADDLALIHDWIAEGANDN